MMEIANRLRRLREEHCLSQLDFGNIMRVNRMTINNYETGKRVPDIDFTMRAADYFGVSVEYIAGRTEFRHREDMEVSAAKAERLMKAVESMPQIESQQMMLDLTALLELANEYDANVPVLIGLIGAIEEYRKILRGYVELEKSLVRSAAELKRQNIHPAQIQAACAEKATALSDYALDAAKSMFGTMRICSTMLQKELAATLVRECGD